MHYKSITLSLFVVTSPFALHAEERTAPVDLLECSSIKDDNARLQCFDQVARGQAVELELGASQAATSPASATVSTAAPREETPQAGRVAEQAPSARFVSEPGKDATKADSSRSSSVGDGNFGLERYARDTPPEVKQIRSTIPGHFSGFSGGTEIRLANGQLWQQMDAARLPVQKKDPEVVIEKGFFGGYRLSVDGLNRSIRVKRIE